MPPGNDVLALQTHIRPALKYLDDILLIVFAAQTEQHPRSVLSDHEFLQFATRRINPDPIGPILPAHALPQCLVTIKDDHFVRRVVQGVYLSSNHRPDSSIKCRRVGDVRLLISIGIVVFFDRVGGEYFRSRYKVDSTDVFQAADDDFFHLPEEARALLVSRSNPRSRA